MIRIPAVLSGMATWLFGTLILKEYFDKKFTLIKGKEDVSLIKGRFPEAWICKDCQTVIFHYGEAVRAPSAKSSE